MAREGTNCDQQGPLSISRRFGPPPERHREMALRIPFVAAIIGWAQTIIPWRAFIKEILCARHCTRYFTCITYSIPPKGL